MESCVIHRKSFIKICIAAYVLLAVFISSCDSQYCSKALLHGNRKHTDRMGVYINIGDYDDYDSYQKVDINFELEEWYMYSFWGWNWELGTPAGGTEQYYGTLDQTADYFYEEEEEVWAMDGLFGWGEVPEFKAECYEEDSDYILRHGICPLDHPYNIESISDDSYETKQAECKASCDADTTCTSYSISRYGCKPSTRTCHFPQIPEGYGFTFVKGLISSEGIGRQAWQSSTDPDVQWGATADKAVDGIRNSNMVIGKSCTQTLAEAQPWWMLDLSPGVILAGVVITGRNDCCEDRLENIIFGALDSSDIDAEKAKLDNYDFSSVKTCKVVPGVFPSAQDQVVECDAELFATALVIYMQPHYTSQILTLCEVQPLTLEIGKYMLVKKRLTHEEAEVECGNFAGGHLAVIDSDEELTVIQSSIQYLGATEDFWLGQDAGYGVEPISTITDGILWNVAKTQYLSKCTQSSFLDFGYECDAAIDGYDDSYWRVDGVCTGAWTKITYRYPMKLFRIRLQQSQISESGFKKVQLEFSDGSIQEITLDGKMNVWDDIPLDPPVTSSYFKIQVLSSYSGADGCGFSEIQTWGQPPYGYKPTDGECDLTYDELFGTPESCEDACRNDPVCVGFVFILSGPDIDLCKLLDATCTTITANVDAVTFDKSDDGGVTIWDGNACDDQAYGVILPGATLTEMYHDCDALPECTAFRFGDTERSFRMGHCDLPAQGDDFTFQFLVNQAAVDSSYAGCHIVENGGSMYFSNLPGMATTDECINHCSTEDGTSFAGVTSVSADLSTCLCGDAFGGFSPLALTDAKCQSPCTNDLLTPCGSYTPTPREVSIYSTDPALTKDCHMASVFNYLTLENNGIITRTYSEFCARKAYSLCERDYDFCITNPCVHGDCTSLDVSYECDCNPGYSGIHCDIDIDECENSPCIHGQCEDGIDQYLCVCDLGYTGDTCETDVDECASDPCQNAGTCTQAIGDHDCACSAGYTGHDCEINIDDCESNPCVKGKCEDGIDMYTCICLPGWEGLRCQTNVDECASGPCKNDATCLDLENRYKCTCKAGYTGKYCSTEIKECISDPCQNGATCNDEENAYACICEPGFAGVHCEINIDECGSRPCENNGACTDGVDSYSCLCVPAFEGKQCQYYVGNPGFWGVWGNWSSCSQTCGTGLRHRSRECFPEHPEQYGDGNCPGDASQTQSCVDADCAPIDGQWGAWFGVSECSSTCGPGLHNVSRFCDSPVPQYGGKNCEGSTNQLMTCQTTPCKNLNNCDQWSTWANCSGQCGSQTQRRQRSCSISESKTDTLLESPLVTTDNETQVNLVESDPQTRKCQSASCQKNEAFSCHVCEKKFNLAGIDTSGCSGKEECDSSQTMCAYTYEPLTTSTATLKKTCATTAQCEQYHHHIYDVIYCTYMRALALESAEMELAEPSQDFQMDDIIATWRSLNESCSICCEGNACNENLIPMNNNVFHLSSSTRGLQAVWVLVSVLVFINFMCT